MDASCSEIRITSFNQEVDNFFKIILMNNVYEISKGRVKEETYKRGRITSDYSITTTRDTLIKMVDEKDFIQRNYNLKKISELKQVEANSVVDVIAIVYNLSELIEFTSQKMQKLFKKRTLILIDESMNTVECTIWNKTAELTTPENLIKGEVVFLPDAKVSHYGGISLSTNILCTNNQLPTLNRVEELKTWVASKGIKGEIKELTVRDQRNISLERMSWEISEERNVGRNPKNIDSYKGCWFEIQGIIAHISHSKEERKPYYLAAPEGSISAGKKVIEQEGQWLCEKDGQLYSTYEPRYIYNFRICDHTNGNFVTCFNETAKKLLGKDASELEKMSYNEKDDKIWNSIVQLPLFKIYNFKLRAREDTYNDQSRIKFDCQSFEEIDYKKESRRLLKLLSNEKL